jgi:transcriptional regulator with XRE-family HTH domain
MLKDLLKNTMDSQGWTVGELARVTGLHIQVIQKIRGGQAVNPTWLTVAKLGLALDVNLNEWGDDAVGTGRSDIVRARDARLASRQSR